MKTLLLLRHAKSSWDDPTVRDFDRPLNQRGLKAAPKMGAFIRKRKLKPDLVLSSPARRARQTTELVSVAGGLTKAARFDERMYEASARRLMEIVSEIDDETSGVMMVGHNPGLDDLLQALTGESRHLPTAALACIEVKIESWTEIAAGSGKLAWLFGPKDLK